MNSVKYNFIMLENEMESYVRIGGEGFEKSYVPLHGGIGVRNFQNYPYVINEWPLINLFFICLLLFIQNK